jgi:hypothetical protein
MFYLFLICNVRKKREKLFSKIVVVVFLALIVLGFTVPGFLYGNGSNVDSTSNEIEPRLCQSDTDCYLICDNQPLAVLCAQNLCLQNECGPSYYEYNPEEPISFKLGVVVDSGENVTKLELSEKNNPQNFYVKFLEKDEIQINSHRLSLNIILDRIAILLHGTCLRIDNEAYCDNDDYFLSVLVNDQEIGDAGNYIPQEADEISISYLPREVLN